MGAIRAPPALRRGVAVGGEPAPAALNQGTVVDVADLYYNTPARRKFLKTEGTEYAHCDDMFRRVALARPDIGLQLTHNGRVIHRLPPGPDNEPVDTAPKCPCLPLAVK